MTSPRIDGLDKNYFINGGMDFAQIDPFGSKTMDGTPTYRNVDKWLTYMTGTLGTTNTKRVADSPNSMTKYAHEFTFRRNGTTLSAVYEHRINSSLSRELIGKNISILLNNKYTGLAPDSIRVLFEAATSENNFTTVTTLLDVTINSIDQTLGTWVKENIDNSKLSGFIPSSSASNGLKVSIFFNYPSGTDASDNFLTNSQFKLNIGTTAQEFSRLGGDLHNELRLCRTELEKSYRLDTALGVINDATGAIYRSNDNSNIFKTQTVEMMEPKILVPTVTLYSISTGNPGFIQTLTSAGGDGGDLAVAPVDISEDRFAIRFTNPNPQFRCHYLADSRL